MTTTRYFEWKVTNCETCPHSHIDGFGLCDFEPTLEVDMAAYLFRKNQSQLTPSCPMWNETKESETK